MTIVHLILRLIHIFAGIFWVGVGFYTALVLGPATRRMGAEGAGLLRTIGEKTGTGNAIGLAGVLTTLPGIILYGIDSGLSPAWVTTGIGTGWTIGGLAGIAAFLHGALVTSRITARIAALGREMTASGGPPTAAQAAAMGQLRAEMQRANGISLALFVIAVLGMAVARYLPW